MPRKSVKVKRKTKAAQTVRLTKNTKPITVDQIANFQTYNFTLNPEYANKNIALINANQVILDTNINNSSDTNTKASDVYVVGIHSGKALDTNTKFILLRITISNIEKMKQATSLSISQVH